MSRKDSFMRRGRVVRNFVKEGSGPVGAACISPDDKMVISCHRINILVWNMLTTGELIGELKGHSAEILSCSINDTLLATGAADGTLLLWKYKEMKRVSKIAVSTGEIMACSLSPDGHLLALGSRSPILRIYIINNGKGSFVQGNNYRDLVGHKDGICDIKFSKDSARLLTSSHDGSVRMWDFSSGACIQEIMIDKPYYPMSSCFATGSIYIVVLTKLGITVMSPTTKDVLWKAKDDFKVMACCSQENTLIAVTAVGRLSCYNIDTQDEFVRKGTPHENDVVCCETSPTSNFFLTGCNDGKILVWK